MTHTADLYTSIVNAEEIITEFKTVSLTMHLVFVFFPKCQGITSIPSLGNTADALFGRMSLQSLHLWHAGISHACEQLRDVSHGDTAHFRLLTTMLFTLLHLTTWHWAHYSAASFSGIADIEYLFVTNWKQRDEML